MSWPGSPSWWRCSIGGPQNAVGSHRRWSGRRTVVVLDGACALRTVPGVARILDRVRRWESTPCAWSGTPSPCRVSAVRPSDSMVNVGRARVGDRARRRGGAIDVVADLPTQAWAYRLARALAPLRDATPPEQADEPPEQARLLDVLASRRHGSSRRSPTDGARAPGPPGPWSAWAPTARPWPLDLARDGPHALVAGTTGAGKSELLQTLVASLALVNRPDEMVFVLVDYKGGSAFRDCERLPHTVGMVTDLDAHLTERALASLGAELRRRKSGAGRTPAARTSRTTCCSGHHRLHADAPPGPGDRRVRHLGRGAAGHSSAGWSPSPSWGARWACTWCWPPNARPAWSAPTSRPTRTCASRCGSPTPASPWT